MPYGLTVKHDQGGKRLEVRCPHHNGLIYVVPGPSSWVCDEEYLHAHSLSGFFKELAGLEDPRVKEAMQRWGVYFRERPLDESESQ